MPSRILQYRGRWSDGVHLTFDDGPHQENTSRILSILERYRVRATFFVVGAYAERHPEILRRIVAGGHLLGSHLYSHRSVKIMSPREWKDEVVRTEGIVFDATGKVPGLLRPPYGEVSFLFVWWVVRTGRRIVLWSDDSHDSFLSEPEGVVVRLRKLPIRNGSIILFHEDYAQTVEALPSILDVLQERGVRFSVLA